MNSLLLRVWVWQEVMRAAVAERMTLNDAGEGVISSAIAVLIMAFLGVALWVAFKAILQGATTNVSNQVSKIGG